MTNERFIVTDHNYLNTGGNTMVSIFAVYDCKENVSRWVIANDVGFNWQTADTVSNSDFSLDCDELMDKIVIGSWGWEALTTDPCWNQHLFEDDEWELFKYCEFEFYKKDCKYFNNKVRLAVNQLPNKLYSKLSADYIKWADEEGVGCLTDGYDVFMDDRYEPPVKEVDREAIARELDRKLQELKDFKQWYVDLIGPNTSEDDLQKLYESSITIAVAGNSIKLDFDAENYSNVLTVLERAIEEF